MREEGIPISSRSDAPRDESNGDEELASDGSTSHVTICSVCQQPIGDSASIQWRGKPVHSDCVAE